MLHADLAGVTDDIQYLLTKVPGHIADVREIIERGAGYLPQIKGIVVKAGSKLPQVADVVNKGIQYLPTIQAIVEDPALPQLVQRVQTLRSLESQARAEAASSDLVGTRSVVLPSLIINELVLVGSDQTVSSDQVTRYKPD